VSALSKMHHYKSDSSRQARREPLQSRVWIVVKVKLEDGRNDDADQAAEEMPKDQGTRLR
jgi:hypothetical protein